MRCSLEIMPNLKVGYLNEIYAGTMRFRPPLQAVNSISQKGSLVWSGFMFVHDGKTTLTLFRDLRLFWSTFNKNMCISTFFCPFYPEPIFDRNMCIWGWVKSKLSESFSFVISGFFGQHSTYILKPKAIIAGPPKTQQSKILYSFFHW